LALGVACLLTAGCDGGKGAAAQAGGDAGKGAGGAKAAEVVVGEFRVSGPYEHGNLAVFLLHGKDRVAAADFLTLKEAMEQKLVVVHETGNVNELSVENQSKDRAVYIQYGDIVKGGKQDRTIQYDLVLSPNSGKVALPSFCVEQGRWRARGSESVAAFQSSDNALATKELKMAAAKSGDQGTVWAKVAETQDKLSANAGQKVNAPESQSSLQLALENKKVKEEIAAYTKALASLPEGKADVVGFAFAVNGKISSVDTYAAGTLFRKLWPKLLEAAATEAFAERKAGAVAGAPAPAEIAKFMAEVEKAAAAEKDVSKRSKTATRENAAAVMIESQDKDQKGEWIHKSYLAK